MTEEERCLALRCPACFFIRGALISHERASRYEGLPCLQTPIYKAARAFAAMAAGRPCTCGLNLTYEEAIV